MEQLKSKIVCENEQELQTLKDKAMKCKIIALDEMNKHPLVNPSHFNKKEKTKLVELMGVWFSKDNDEIDKWFNDIVNERILCNNVDYDTYPVYDLRPTGSLLESNDRILCSSVDYDLTKGANGPPGPICDLYGLPI